MDFPLHAPVCDLPESICVIDPPSRIVRAREDEYPESFPSLFDVPACPLQVREREDRLVHDLRDFMVRHEVISLNAREFADVISVDRITGSRNDRDLPGICENEGRHLDDARRSGRDAQVLRVDGAAGEVPTEEGGSSLSAFRSASRIRVAGYPARNLVRGGDRLDLLLQIGPAEAFSATLRGSAPAGLSLGS
eukprot:CAMPEP_0170569562 /NCGR_PEP_ID=MMETSP0224-20130122/620_1 /TAXON_ID=285029 /ORGANISM="Togula jolla, Strain CCCM 725" /LENGTH=192 /DNA_ID=CAMNT_0010891735 /DNA_START=628 /DNA_END=1207 /DNA_ORIENTATION=-